MSTIVTAFFRRRWVRRLLELLVVVLVIVGIRAWQGPDIERGPAPHLSGITLEGELVSLSGYAGAPLLLVFWAEWCHICRLELPLLKGLVEEHQVLTIAMQSGDDAQVREFLRASDLEFLPVLNDTSGWLSHSYGVRGVPAIYVLDGEGRIRFTESGLTSPWGLRVRLWWAGRG